MKRKILFCATIDEHFKFFHLPYMQWLQENGWEVHIASKGKMSIPYSDRKYTLPIERSPLKWSNLKAYRELKKIINENKYDIVHCHTPMGGILGRLAARKARKSGTKVLYTAHGFHFCKDAPLINWIVYYPLEKWLAHYCDCLITVSKEDYELAVRHGFKAGRIEHIYGIGVNTERFTPVSSEEKNRLRQKNGYDPGQFILFYAAELNKNKNQELLIKAIYQCIDKIPSIKLILAGIGPLEEEYRKLCQELGLSGIVDFLGYRNDIDELINLSDVVTASSLREGLPINILEAIACDVPIIAVDNRGHRELVLKYEKGCLVSGKEENQMADAIINMFKSLHIRSSIRGNREEILKEYSITNVLSKMSSIYEFYGGG